MPLSFLGLGFALTAVPIDMEYSSTPLSKVHIVAICLGLALGLFRLSRLGYNQKIKQKIRNRTHLTPLFLVVSIMGFELGFWSMPITHRLVFMTVFGWTGITSIELMYTKETNKKF